MDPIERCKNLQIRFQQIEERFAKLPVINPYDEKELQTVFDEIEGNEDKYVGAYWLEEWLFKHGV